jgi:hypothetical protein
MENLPCQGVDRRHLDRLFRELGGTISFPKRTGEVRYWHPLVRRYATANGRRKDAPRHLVEYVRIVIHLRRVAPVRGWRNG